MKENEPTLLQRGNRLFSDWDQRLQPIRFLTGGDLKSIALLLIIAEHFFKIFTGPIIEYYDSPAAWGMQDFAITKLYSLTAIAFPLFAFLLTEGFIHTHDRKNTVVPCYCLL